jgi:STE24 endopeptidase
MKGCVMRFTLWALALGMALWLAPSQATAQPAGSAPAMASSPSAATPAAADAASAAGRSGFYIRPVDDAWRAALPMDAQAATQAYLDRLPADVVARSNAYYEGGYWLQLWNWLAGLLVALLLLGTRPSTALRDWATRRLKWAPLRDGLYGAVYTVAGSLLVAPLTLYQGFVREHDYGMATQTLGAWLGEQLLGLGVSVVVGALLVALLYAVLRRAGAQWWLWGTGVALGFMCLVVAVAPVWIEPLFNTYKPVPEGPVKTAVLAMAHANGVPVDNVYVYDASRQTTRVSANVSGLFGSAAIRLNDNLLNRSSEPEILAVMAHEIGHYAMNHIPKTLVMFGGIILFGFLFVQWAMRHLLARFGARWRLDGKAGVTDVASLPLLAALFGTYMFLATPLLNTITRTQEVEADLYGLNLAREPHGEAEVLLKLTEYRKAEPGPLEEIIFYTHPSTRTRIYNAMRWREQMMPAGESVAKPTGK